MLSGEADPFARIDLLRSAAEEAARNWTFPPSTFNGKPARIAGYLDFEFKL